MKIKPILLISALPPPSGGIATWTQKILETGFPENIPVTLVDTKIRGSRHVASRVSMSITEIVRNARIFFSMIYQLVMKRPRLVHLSCSLSPVGIFRDLMCAVLARLFMLPVVSHYRGNLPNFNGQRCFGLSQICLRALIRIASVNIVENQFSLTAIQQDSAYHSKLTFLLPNFVNDQVFHEPFEKKSTHSTRYRALYVGWITGTKGCREILAMAQQLSAVDFVLVGKMYADMEALFANPPPNIILLGAQDHPGVLQEMGRSDCLIFPTYSEGFPLSVVEAMSVGLPVISTKVGALPEMIDEGKGGYLVEPQAVDALVQALKKLLTHPELSISMGRYNREKSFREYRYSVVIQRLFDIYQHVLAEKIPCAE